MTDKRPRGRPKGTGIKDDQHLDAVANLIVRQPDLKKTPAISKIVQRVFPEHQWSAAERRLLRKWNKSAEERLEAAQERYEEEKRERRALRSVPTSALLSQFAIANDFAAKVGQIDSVNHKMLNPSFMEALQERASRIQQIHDKIDLKMLRNVREQSEMINKRFRGF